ncbi:MAG: hypothetical protein OEY20_17970 [Gemmatimonadota bacterium]|nr:hypothetical protein [Gemmatimonadota bacterium]
MAAPPIVAVLTTVLAPDPHGHWSEHLAFAALKGAQLALLLVLVTILRWRRLSPWLLAAFAIIAVGIGLQAAGDYQVADSIWGTVGDPGFGPGYDKGHDRSAFGDLFVLGGGLVFAIIAGATRRAPARVAVSAAILAVIPPPFLWPAAGVMLLLYWLTRSSPLAPGSSPAPAGRPVSPVR